MIDWFYPLSLAKTPSGGKMAPTIELGGCFGDSFFAGNWSLGDGGAQ